jgi:hypothetical protein
VLPGKGRASAGSFAAPLRDPSIEKEKRSRSECHPATAAIAASPMRSVEVEFVRADGPSPGEWSGAAGMVEGTRDWLNTWENSRAEVDEYRELDAEHVLVWSDTSAVAR